MNRLADGDDGCLGEIYDRVAPTMRDYLLPRMGGDRARVDEAVRTILLELHRGRAGYVPGADVLEWAFSFARHLVDPQHRSDATFKDDVLDLAMRGFRAEQIAAVLDVPPGRVVAQLEQSRARMDASLASSSMSGARVRGATMDGADLVGSDIDSYHIDALVDRGGFGKVYRATHEFVGARAIKVMHDDAHDDPEAFDRFKGEALMMLGIKHPNIVEVYDVGRLRDGRGWYAMEFLAGKSLAKVIADHRRLAWSRVAGLVQQICHGLAVVHAKDIVHGDIKPANCFVVGDDPATQVVKVLDFGVAQLVAPTCSRHAVGPPRAVVGTRDYLAPELLSGRAADARVDVYALGVMMFEMLTGRLPFDSIVARCVNAVPTLAAAAPGMKFQRGVERVVRRALATDPAQRFASVDELRIAIEALGPTGRGRLPLALLGRSERVRMCATASLSALVASVGTAFAIVVPRPVPPQVEAALTPTHVEATLAPVRPRLAACRADIATESPPRARLLVLGATGQVIGTELLGVDPDSDAGECLESALYDLRFPRFVEKQQPIECDL